MASHSGKSPEDVIGKNLFECFPDLPQSWLEKKLKGVFLLKNFAFTTWEQRPYLFKFYHNRPATSIVADMQQNCTFIPVKEKDGAVNTVCITISDVTDTSIFQLMLAQSKDLLEKQSQRDGLTNIYNRNFWESQLRVEVNRIRRHGQSLSVAMIDIDHFKRINDNLGHLAGDEVIRRVAKIIEACLRECDAAGRYGGEEFGATLVNTDKEGALVCGERIRLAIEQATISFNDTLIPVTASVGVATLSDAIADADELIDQADRALYTSKRAGRNRVTVYEPDKSD